VIVDEEELDDGSDLDLTPANALNQQAWHFGNSNIMGMGMNNLDDDDIGMDDV
jgi:hypothetical protein